MIIPLLRVRAKAPETASSFEIYANVGVGDKPPINYAIEKNPKIVRDFNIL